MPDTTPTTEDRTRIADALATADGWEWAEGFDKTQSPSYQGYLRQADAVLAALLAPARLVSGTTDQPPVPAEVCPEHGAACHIREWPAPGTATAAPVDRAAVLREAADAIETAQHQRDDLVNEALGFLDNNTEQQQVGMHRAAAVLRRLADEAQPATNQPTEAEEPTEEQIVREHVTTVHLIGEQLEAVESWLWERLADVRAAAADRPDTETEAAK